MPNFGRKIKKAIIEGAKSGEEEVPMVDLTSLYEKYKGQWVALKDDSSSVIASDKVLSVAKEKAQKKGFNNPVFMRVPSAPMPFIG